MIIKKITNHLTGEEIKLPKPIEIETDDDDDYKTKVSLICIELAKNWIEEHKKLVLVSKAYLKGDKK